MKGTKTSIILVEILDRMSQRFCNMLVFIDPPILLLRIWLKNNPPYAKFYTENNHCKINNDHEKECVI